MTDKLFDSDFGYAAFLAARVERGAQVVELVPGQNLSEYPPQRFHAAEVLDGNTFKVGASIGVIGIRLYSTF